jgi:hypothetical protein
MKALYRTSSRRRPHWSEMVAALIGMSIPLLSAIVASHLA